MRHAVGRGRAPQEVELQVAGVGQQALLGVVSEEAARRRRLQRQQRCVRAAPPRRRQPIRCRGRRRGTSLTILVAAVIEPRRLSVPPLRPLFHRLRLLLIVVVARGVGVPTAAATPQQPQGGVGHRAFLAVHSAPLPQHQ